MSLALTMIGAASQPGHLAGVVEPPQGATVLVDAGPDPDVVARDLAAFGVRRLDVAVATHLHVDHVGGFAEVLARFAVGMLVVPGCPDDSPTATSFERATEEESVEPVVARAGTDEGAKQLLDLGVESLVRPELEGGIQMLRSALALVVASTFCAVVIYHLSLPLVLLIMGPSGMLLAAGHEWLEHRRQRGSTT